MVTPRPYTDFYEHDIKDSYTRCFSRDVDLNELVWHRDAEDRLVTVLAGGGWGFQYDNKMPQPLSVGSTLSIPKMTYHRLLKGTTDLRLKIVKLST